ncbi:MAG TPA: hypothetical protein PLS49_07960 [Candidatus Woesebacteria bacterium]|nr:hypothetical protein [Candidatus Woesebacteria bacterium]
MSIHPKKLLDLIGSNEIVRASVILLFSQTFTNVLNYLYNIVVGKILSRQNLETSAYGEFWALSSLSYYLLVPITALTLVATKQVADWYAVKKNSNIKHYVNNVNIKIVWITLFLTFLSIVFTPVLKTFLHIDSALSIIILNISIISTLLYSVNTALLLGLRKFLLGTVLIVIPVMFKLVFGSILTYFYGVQGAVSGNLIQSILITILSFILVKRTLNKLGNSEEQPSKFHFPWKLFISSVLATFSLSSFLSTDVILVKHFLSSEYIDGVAIPSIYSMLSLFGRIIYFLGISLSSLVIPFANFSKNNGKKISITLYSMMLGLALVTPLIGIYFIFPDYLIKLIFTDSFTVGAKFLGPYALATSFYALSSIMISHFISKSDYSFAKIPLFFSIIQVILILFKHDNIEDFIAILFIVNFLCLMSMIWYNYKNYYNKK